MSGCNCHECAEGRAARYAFRHGGEDWEADYDEPVKYKKPARSNWRGKRKRPCKKSKTGEVCDFSVKQVYRSYNYRNSQAITDYVMTCSRCGKHGEILWGRILWNNEG